MKVKDVLDVVAADITIGIGLSHDISIDYVHQMSAAAVKDFHDKEVESISPEDETGIIIYYKRSV